jgi:2',3'-cyclic-nucleotide 2'-phosphodiesterase (5'-nucleotidase family)
MQSRFYTILLALSIGFTACKTQQKYVDSYQTSFTVIDSTLQKNSKVEIMLEPYRVKMHEAMDQVIGYSEVPMSKAQPECTMGNFMADAQLDIARKTEPGTQISVMNYGGIRIPYVSPGAITKGKIYEMMPFDNKLTIVELPGKVLHQMCDQIAAYGGWPVSGISFEIKDKKAVHILVSGKPVNDQLIYLTAMSDYIANGGDNCDFLMDCKKRYLNIFVRDMLIEYVTGLQAKGEKLNPKLEKRISYAE